MQAFPAVEVFAATQAGIARALFLRRFQAHHCREFNGSKCGLETEAM
jgi:hypothetical protein